MKRLAKAIAHPVRLRILIALNQNGPMSPSQFLREYGRGSDMLTSVSRQFRQAAQYGVIEEIERKRGGHRRGAVEHIYRAVQPLEFDRADWSSLPEPYKNTFTVLIHQTFAEQVREAIVAGTIDAREDRHFTWMTIALDQKGWNNVIARTDAHFRFVRAEAKRAEKALAKTDAEPVAVTVGLAAFEAPPHSLRKPSGD